MSRRWQPTALRERAARIKVLRYAPTPLARGAYGDLDPGRALPSEATIGCRLKPATAVAELHQQRHFQPADSTLADAVFGPKDGVHLTEHYVLHNPIHSRVGLRHC
jgi:hypothetical protein